MTRLPGLLLLAGVLAPGLIAASSPARADTGMLGWPDTEIVQALDAFVPRLMAEENVPGAQVALWRKGRLVYERGFGTANAWSGRPVTAATLFEAAGLSKPVAAMAALQMVAEGLIALDGDIGRGIEPAWLAPGPDGAVPAITLRQILTHTSGLGNDVTTAAHVPEALPGARFAWSGEGFGYLGYVLAAYRQAPFADVVAQQVLWPLGMEAGGFALAPRQMPRMAAGHAPVWMPVALVVVPFAGAGLAALVLVWLWVRLGLGLPRLEPAHLPVPLAAGAIAAPVTVLEVAGLGLALAVLLTAAVAGLALALATVLWRLVFHAAGLTRLAPGTVVRRHEAHAGHWRRVALALGALTIAPVMFLNAPVPLRAPGDVHPAATLRTTAGDLARFAGDLMAPSLLPPGLGAEMTLPQVTLADGIAWGLGIGLRDRALPGGGTQRTLWHAGSTPGYRSLMVAEPASGTALVILTNAQTGETMTQTLAAHAFGGIGELEKGDGWRLPD